MVNFTNSPVPNVTLCSFHVHDTHITDYYLSIKAYNKLELYVNGLMKARCWLYTCYVGIIAQLVKLIPVPFTTTMYNSVLVHVMHSVSY